jgi:hypothetical protein
VTPAERRAALELEADRLKARLDDMDRILAGTSDAWLGIQERLGSEVAEVTVNAPLAEARQMALAFATIVKTLDGTAAKETGPTGPVSSPADEVRAAREKKLKEAAARVAGQA